jgi:type II secretory pathway component PulC
MAINKNFPNYKKEKLTFKVVVDPKRPTAPGPNRASRRKEVAEKRREPENKRRAEVAYAEYQSKIARRAKIEKHHEENRKRSAARKATLKK